MGKVLTLEHLIGAASGWLVMAVARAIRGKQRRLHVAQGREPGPAHQMPTLSRNYDTGRRTGYKREQSNISQVPECAKALLYHLKCA